jgi:hypothetical protein
MIVETIMTKDIRNVVWLAADVHYVQANAYDPSGDGEPDFHEFIAGPLSANPVRPVAPAPTFRPTNLFSDSGRMSTRYGTSSCAGRAQGRSRSGRSLCCPVLAGGMGMTMWLQILSVIGALMVLVAYGLNQNGVWRELDGGYLALNIIGSLLLGLVAVLEQQAGFILLEFSWAAIGIMGVIRARRLFRPS